MYNSKSLTCSSKEIPEEWTTKKKVKLSRKTKSKGTQNHHTTTTFPYHRVTNFVSSFQFTYFILINHSSIISWFICQFSISAVSQMTRWCLRFRFQFIFSIHWGKEDLFWILKRMFFVFPSTFLWMYKFHPIVNIVYYSLYTIYNLHIVDGYYLICREVCVLLIQQLTLTFIIRDHIRIFLIIHLLRVTDWQRNFIFNL